MACLIIERVVSSLAWQQLSCQASASTDDSLPPHPQRRILQIALGEKVLKQQHPTSCVLSPSRSGP
ncbi:hypothetical protein NITLEN_40284 [Nitrospira lenta]|uniref:Uncharacterized protein n=1 Tax=Nitrospira lenta TaxID=1436998 RepID=A0A330L9Q5_9BACT|nr:hypothetical protein NITLEN_40284 [Nitrospira lenta]